MRHSIRLACVRYRLRPVTVEDAPFIVELRSNPELNRFLHEVSPRVEDQVEWIERYYERPDDYYFIVEDAESGQPQGAIGIYNLAENRADAEWGRWVLKHDSIAALESVWLICEVGFTKLNLESLSARTLADNLRVISFHDSFGATRTATLKDHFHVRGETKTAIEHRIAAAKWPELRARYYTIISRLAHRVHQ